jgi:hypothetical protein
VPHSEQELAYYRAIEDFFAAVRGVPHLLSPKDFQLMRTWWRERVPLAAVTGGITEVLAKRRDRGDSDPVTSLSYCRHAVRRHAKRLAEMHVGETPAALTDGEATPQPEAIRPLVDELRRTAKTWNDRLPEVAAVITRIVDQLESVPEMPPALLEEHLYSLESVLLERCWRALRNADRDAVERESSDAADGAGATAAARDRTKRAVRDREVRRLLGLPRLELG